MTGTVRILALLVVAAMTLVPFVVMFATSLAGPAQIYAGGLLPAPDAAAAADNYRTAWTNVPMLRYLLNGTVVCSAILVLQITVAAPAGYALAKLPFSGRPVLLAATLLALMIPMQVPAIPLFVAVAQAGLLNSYTALIVPFVISAFALFLFRQFFLSYPDEVLEAARLDGFSELSIVWRLMVPAAKPAVAAFATISIINHWNDLYWPLVVITETEMMTPPVGILAFRSTAESSGNLGALMAGGVIVTAPLVIAFLFLQRSLIRGLTASART
ncbi:carbohydrate ABC transporter permease [Marivita sp. GX14005]|uniref:carbohydrate ABC transporter permease n=1 Tax=Marivita sp. GX14005 TaxID=2942276 RepID=UPI0020196EB1|nr:carbohydrate ABC transporter permease [Marivita sp. GX14005]MCL3883383.1 carbohydrate ABC transporter permease [Marivita sp. GX14005]